MSEYTPIAIIFAVLAVVIAALVIATNENGKTFRKACDEIHGKAVYDGRQWQCMKGQQ